MDNRKAPKFHSIHCSTLRRVRMRKDFDDSVAALTDLEDKEFETLQAHIDLQKTIYKGRPANASPVYAADAPVRFSDEWSESVSPHQHLPQFSARTASVNVDSKLGRPRIGAVGLVAGGLILAFWLCLAAAQFAQIF